MNLIVATTQFSLRVLKNENDFWERAELLILKARAQNAELILFPEYFSLSWILNQANQGSFLDRIKQVNSFLPVFKEKFQLLANKHQLCIVAGTVPILQNNQLLNRCFVFEPILSKEHPAIDDENKSNLYQDKINMTRFENEEWGVSSGQLPVTVFNLKGIKIGIAICYDIEFPKYCLELAKQKVDLILVPSCTDDVHGYWRVRHCAEARCIENQAFVVMSSIVDGNSNYPEISEHHGQGGFYTPCDIGFPEGGVLKLGDVNQEGVAVANLDFVLLEKIRKNGTVLNLRDQLS